MPLLTKRTLSALFIVPLQLFHNLFAVTVFGGVVVAIPAVCVCLMTVLQSTFYVCHKVCVFRNGNGNYELEMLDRITL